MKFAFSLICLLLVWMGFAFSPLSVPVLGGQARATERMHASDTPWDVTRFLAEKPSQGLVWAPSYWSDWIRYRADPNASYFTSSNLAAMPSQVRRDYQRVLVGDAAWESTLGRYAVETLVIDKVEQDRLFNIMMREGKDWRIVFESPTACVLRKKEV